MKNLILTTTLLVLGLVPFASADAYAQTNKRLNSTPAAFQTFYTNFRNALIYTFAGFS